MRLAKYLVIIAAMALIATGSATASSLITSRKIADNTIASRDIRNGTIEFRDLSAPVQQALTRKNPPAGVSAPVEAPVGPAGAQGATGAAGPTGAPGATGATGQSGTNGANAILAPTIVPGEIAHLTGSVEVPCPAGTHGVGVAAIPASVRFHVNAVSVTFTSELGQVGDPVPVEAICA